jgi:ribosomal protein S18 acetylase RimI-like enzyme
MAVLNSYQKKGIGEKLIQYAETEIKKQKSGIIWFNARIAAANFYKKSDYQIIGESFEIKDVGPHYLMFKKL